ncbi:hypothetical protein GALL_408160 [mine drainage metagenome]|uniref:Multi-ubiquitin domain-containing protein n=1 Tax=mine drainage metagenome TaxID=410659 RepID=A0A1J5QNA7_9ZZZZ
MNEIGQTSDVLEVNGAQSEKAALSDYFVNGERFSTSEHKLTVRQILENAGFSSAEQFRLVRDNGSHPFTDYGTEVPIHDGERFTAIFIDPTQTS